MRSATKSPMRATITLRTLAASLSALAVLAGLAGCATPPPASDPDAVAEFKETNDPLEPANRKLFAFNEGLDSVVVRPLVELYRTAVPGEVRGHFHNVLANLDSPIILANDMLQGRTRTAGDTLLRFMINSTVGVAGVFDVAQTWGIPGHSNDFGTTLAVWGIGEGPFLFLPLLGPSSPRDGIGYGADIGMDPLTWINAGAVVTDLGYARWGLDVVDTFAEVQPDIDKALATALDPYATYRSLYRQYRQAAIEKARDDMRAAAPAAH